MLTLSAWFPQPAEAGAMSPLWGQPQPQLYWLLNDLGTKPQKHNPSMDYQLCPTSSGSFYKEEWTRHWLTSHFVGLVSKLTFFPKNVVDKLAVMLWVLATSLPLPTSWALLCTDVDASVMHICKWISHTHSRYKHRRMCGSRQACLKVSVCKGGELIA